VCARVYITGIVVWGCFPQGKISEKLSVSGAHGRGETQAASGSTQKEAAAAPPRLPEDAVPALAIDNEPRVSAVQRRQQALARGNLPRGASSELV